MPRSLVGFLSAVDRVAIGLSAWRKPGADKSLDIVAALAWHCSVIRAQLPARTSPPNDRRRVERRMALPNQQIHQGLWQRRSISSHAVALAYARELFAGEYIQDPVGTKHRLQHDTPGMCGSGMADDYCFLAIRVTAHRC